MTHRISIPVKLSSRSGRVGAAVLAALLSPACSGSTVDLGENEDGQGAPAPAHSRCRTSPILEGDIVVETQQQLDELEGCKVIEGSLTIVPFAEANVRALHALREVDGSLELGTGSPGIFFGQDPLLLELGGWLSSLEGLERLERVGRLELVGVAADKLRPLSRLTQAKEGISIASCLALESLAGLENVEPVTALEIYASPLLADATALRLAETMATLVLWTPIEVIDASSVRRIDGDVYDDREYHAPGQLQLYRTRLTNLDSFAGVEVVSELEINNNDLLVDATSLDARVGSLQVQGNPQLVRLGSFGTPSVVSIAGNPRLVELPAFGVSGLPSPYPVWDQPGSARFEIFSNALIERVALPDGVQRMASVSIYDSPRLQEIDFATVEAIDTLHIRNNPALERVSLGSLAGVPELTVVDNPSLDPAVFDDLATFEREMSGNAAF